MAAPSTLYAPAHIVQRRPSLGATGPGPYDAPSMIYLGTGLQDNRLIFNQANSATGAGIIGWQGMGLFKVVSGVPSALSATKIAALQTVATGVPMTLVSTTANGITVIPTGGQLSFPFLNTIPAGACAIDGPQSITRFGQTGAFFTAFYNPTSAICRVIGIAAAASATGGAFLIKGADFYGQAMSQTVTAVANSTVYSLKAFKYVYSVTPQFTDATYQYSVGVGDVYGLPLAADYYADTDFYWNNVIPAASYFTPAVTTSPATAATGDTRGTFSTPSASNGTIRMDVYVEPTLSRLAQQPSYTGLFGVTQA